MSSSKAVSVDLVAIKPDLPEVAILELTNPEYYTSTMTQIRRSLAEKQPEMRASTSSFRYANYNSTGGPVLVPLNDIHLEIQQAMVLSYIGKHP